jgi:hypothetical protein
MLTCNEAFEACFCEVHAPHLTTFHVKFDENEAGGAAFSWNSLEAAPAIEVISEIVI